jgi:ankyrin repeat protein
MAAAYVSGLNTATIRHHGAGPVNTNSGSGEQINNTISGGSGNTQYNATYQHFHGTRVSDQDQLDEDFRKTLFLTSPEIDREDLIDIKEGRVSNTCEWIRTTKEYAEFLEGTHRMLWIWGEPGKGKTMLSIFMSRELEQKNKTKTIFFFCRAEHEKRNSAVAVLRGLLWHLTGLCPELTRVLRKKCESAVNDTLSSRETLWISFKELIVAAQSERLYCVIDGLDECDESSQRWLAGKLASLHNDSDTSSCSIVVLSRYLVELKDTHQVNLDSDYTEQVRSDVKVFVEARTEKLFQRITFSDTHRNELQERLLEGAQGSFLWVGFAMIDLLRQKNENGVMRAMGRLPAGLFPLYDRMLRDIEPDQRRTSLSVLRLVVLACRPLTLDELAFVVPCCSLQDPPLTGKDIRDLTEVCGPLFRVKDQTVGLVHESVRDYTKEAVFPDGFGLKSHETHLQLAKACIDALDVEAQSSPLAGYAIDFWPHHARRSDVLTEKLIFHSRAFFDTSSRSRASWWSIFCMHNIKINLMCDFDAFRNIGRFHMACFLGIKPWAEQILKKYKSRYLLGVPMSRNPVRRRDSEGWTALHWAAFAGQEPTVRLLLDQEVNIDAKDHDSKTALHWATIEHHEAITKLLLDREADVDARAVYYHFDYGNRRGRTALHHAAEEGHEVTAMLLLDHRANVNIKDSAGATALHLSAEKDHVAMTKLLIDRGADVNAERKDGTTALHLTVGQDNIAMVKLLIDHRADINAQMKDGTAVLHLVAGGGIEAGVRLLLEHGADVDVTDKGHRTALYHAVSAWPTLTGYAQLEAIVVLLLEHQVDINAKARKGKTALLKAFKSYDRMAYSHDTKEEADQRRTAQCRIMRVLVDHGAQFDAESAEGVRILRAIRNTGAIDDRMLIDVRCE